MAQNQNPQTMQMPPAQVKGGKSDKRKQMESEVSNMGILGEIKRDLNDPTKRAALERLLASMGSGESVQ